MVTNTNTKDVVLVYDDECATAIMYKYQLKSGIYKDSEGNYCHSFNRTDEVVDAVFEYYHSPNFSINLKEYITYREECLAEYYDLCGSFDSYIAFKESDDDKA